MELGVSAAPPPPDLEAGGYPHPFGSGPARGGQVGTGPGGRSRAGGGDGEAHVPVTPEALRAGVCGHSLATRRKRLGGPAGELALVRDWGAGAPWGLGGRPVPRHPQGAAQQWGRLGSVSPRSAGVQCSSRAHPRTHSFTPPARSQPGRGARGRRAGAERSVERSRSRGTPGGRAPPTAPTRFEGSLASPSSPSEPCRTPRPLPPPRPRSARCGADRCGGRMLPGLQPRPEGAVSSSDCHLVQEPSEQEQPWLLGL